MRSMGGSMLHKCAASSLDCSTPCAVRGGSVGMPVGVRDDAVYSPVLGLTLKLERNWRLLDI
jgi:hypothetical protein